MDGGFAFYQSKDDNYITRFFNVWWAQYEGVDGFEDFWYGIPLNMLTDEPDVSVFETHRGRYEALEVMRNLLRYHGTTYTGTDLDGNAYSTIDEGNGGYFDPNGWTRAAGCSTPTATGSLPK